MPKLFIVNQVPEDVLGTSDSRTQFISKGQRIDDEHSYIASTGNSENSFAIVGYHRQGLPFNLLVTATEDSDNGAIFAFIEDHLKPLIEKYADEYSKDTGAKETTMALITQIMTLRNSRMPLSSFAMALAITYQKNNALYVAGFSIGHGVLLLRKKQTKEIRYLSYHNVVNGHEESFNEFFKTRGLKNILARNAFFSDEPIAPDDEIVGLTHLPLEFQEQAESSTRIFQETRVKNRTQKDEPVRIEEVESLPFDIVKLGIKKEHVFDDRCLLNQIHEKFVSSTHATTITTIIIPNMKLQRQLQFVTNDVIRDTLRPIDKEIFEQSNKALFSFIQKVMPQHPQSALHKDYQILQEFQQKAQYIILGLNDKHTVLRNSIIKCLVMTQASIDLRQKVEPVKKLLKELSIHFGLHTIPQLRDKVTFKNSISMIFEAGKTIEQNKIDLLAEWEKIKNKIEAALKLFRQSRLNFEDIQKQYEHMFNIKSIYGAHMEELRDFIRKRRLVYLINDKTVPIDAPFPYHYLTENNGKITTNDAMAALTRPIIELEETVNQAFKATGTKQYIDAGTRLLLFSCSNEGRARQYTYEAIKRFNESCAAYFIANLYKGELTKQGKLLAELHTKIHQPHGHLGLLLEEIYRIWTNHHRVVKEGWKLTTSYGDVGKIIDNLFLELLTIYQQAEALDDERLRNYLKENHPSVQDQSLFDYACDPKVGRFLEDLLPLPVTTSSAKKEFKKRDGKKDDVKVKPRSRKASNSSRYASVSSEKLPPQSLSHSENLEVLYTHVLRARMAKVEKEQLDGHAAKLSILSDELTVLMHSSTISQEVFKNRVGPFQIMLANMLTELFYTPFAFDSRKNQYVAILETQQQPQEMQEKINKILKNTGISVEVHADIYELDKSKIFIINGLVESTRTKLIDKVDDIRSVLSNKPQDKTLFSSGSFHSSSSSNSFSSSSIMSFSSSATVSTASPSHSISTPSIFSPSSPSSSSTMSIETSPSNGSSAAITSGTSPALSIASTDPSPKRSPVHSISLGFASPPQPTTTTEVAASFWHPFETFKP